MIINTAYFSFDCPNNTTLQALEEDGVPGFLGETMLADGTMVGWQFSLIYMPPIGWQHHFDMLTSTFGDNAEKGENWAICPHPIKVGHSQFSPHPTMCMWRGEKTYMCIITADIYCGDWSVPARKLISDIMSSVSFNLVENMPVMEPGVPFPLILTV